MTAASGMEYVTERGGRRNLVKVLSYLVTKSSKFEDHDFSWLCGIDLIKNNPETLRSLWIFLILGLLIWTRMEHKSSPDLCAWKLSELFFLFILFFPQGKNFLISTLLQLPPLVVTANSFSCDFKLIWWLHKYFLVQIWNWTGEESSLYSLAFLLTFKV